MCTNASWWVWAIPWGAGGMKQELDLPGLFGMAACRARLCSLAAWQGGVTARVWDGALTDHPFRRGCRRDMSHLNLRKGEKQTGNSGVSQFFCCWMEGKGSARAGSPERQQRLSGGPITSPWVQTPPVPVMPGQQLPSCRAAGSSLGFGLWRGKFSPCLVQ